MLRLPIIQRESDATICLPDNLLPSFYMEDYTVMGLRVENVDAAVRWLEKSGIRLLKTPNYSELFIEKRNQIPHIIQFLNEKGIACTISDIVDHVYQG